MTQIHEGRARAQEAAPVSFKSYRDSLAFWRSDRRTPDGEPVFPLRFRTTPPKDHQHD